MRLQTSAQGLARLVGLFALLLLAPWGMLRADDVHPSSSFTILHVTDTHLCKLDGYNDALVKKRDHFGHAYEPFCELLDTVPGRVGADAMVITGDMIDFYEGETTDGTLRGGQVEGFTALLPRAKVPVWMALGNHDIQTHVNSPSEVANNGGRTTTNPHAQKARAAWIRQAECFREGRYYAKDLRVGTTHWKLYFLDNAYQLMNSTVRVTYWDVPQLDWLNNELKQSPDQKAILFFHIPLAASLPSDGPGAAQGIYKVLDDHPCVVAAFCGHGHKNIVFDKIRLPGGHAITQVETAAFGYDRNAWRTIKLGEKAVSVSKPGSRETEIVIEAPALAASPAVK